MSLKLQYELIALREQVEKLADAVAALSLRIAAVESKRETLHLKDSKRG